MAASIAMDVLTRPGVYINELFNLSLSVSSGATAVPIIADNPIHSPELEQAVRLESWLDFVSRLDEGYQPRRHLHRILHAYFTNGGGPCYVVRADKMAEEIGKFDDITLLVSAGWDISDAVSQWCQPGLGKFAIIDGPCSDLAKLTGWPGTAAPPGEPARPANPTIPGDEGSDTIWGIDTMKKVAPSPHVAAYYPYLTADYSFKVWVPADDDARDADDDELLEKTVVGTLAVPPSAVMAGIYCKVDRERGVWKAPANVPVTGGFKLMHRVTDALQGDYNKEGALNMLRSFGDGGVTVWGARTAAPGTQASWKYIPVRRLFDAAERDIRRAMQPVVFELNIPYTWNKAKVAIDNYLHKLWRAGALQGARPEEAYFVQIGLGLTMTQEDIDNGKMLVRIGMAAARPAEFIILEFTQELA